MCEAVTAGAAVGEAAAGAETAGAASAAAAASTAAEAAAAAGAAEAVGTTGAAYGATASAAATTATAGMSAAQLASLGLTATSLATSAYSAYSQSATAKKVAGNNAAAADLAAQSALAKGQTDATAVRARGNVLMGQQRAALATRGLDLSGGTPADILGSTDYFSQVDQAQTITNSRQDAYAKEAQMAGFQNTENGQTPGLNLAGSLLGSGGAVADKWYNYSKG